MRLANGIMPFVRIWLWLCWRPCNKWARFRWLGTAIQWQQPHQSMTYFPPSDRRLSHNIRRDRLVSHPEHRNWCLLASSMTSGRASVSVGLPSLCSHDYRNIPAERETTELISRPPLIEWVQWHTFPCIKSKSVMIATLSASYLIMLSVSPLSNPSANLSL